QRATRLSNRGGAHALHMNEEIAASALRFAPALRIAPRHLTRNFSERRLGALHRYAVLETPKSNRAKIVGALGQHPRGESKWEEDVGDGDAKARQREGESGGHDTHDFRRGAGGEGDLLADHRAIGAVPAAPEAVADHNHER